MSVLCMFISIHLLFRVLQTIVGRDFCTIGLNFSLKCSSVNVLVWLKSRNHFIKCSFMMFLENSLRISESGDKTDTLMSLVVRKLNRNKLVLLFIIFKSYKAFHFKYLVLLGILERIKK